MDTEETMEDLVTTVEEPETTQDPATVEETSREIKEAFSRNLSNFMITRDSTRVKAVIMFSPPTPPSEQGS